MKYISKVTSALFHRVFFFCQTPLFFPTFFFSELSFLYWLSFFLHFFIMLDIAQLEIPLPDRPITLKLQNRSIGVFKQQTNFADRRITSYEVLKLWKGPSGATYFSHLSRVARTSKKIIKENCWTNSLKYVLAQLVAHVADNRLWFETHFSCDFMSILSWVHVESWVRNDLSRDLSITFMIMLALISHIKYNFLNSLQLLNFVTYRR